MSTTEIRIRPAIADDAESIHAMVLALAESTGMAHLVRSTPDDFRRHGFGEPKCFECLIAEQEGKAMGLCLYFFSFSSWFGKRGVYVQDIFVDPAARGTGLGKRLLAETASRAAEQGAAFMRLAVDKDNRGARAFYEHVGMVHADHDFIYKAWDKDFEALRLLTGNPATRDEKS
jgi:GNAT superfamily N-acetyltransferase